MTWRKSGDLFLGQNQCEIRSLRIKDELGYWRRLRVCTVWQPAATSFTRTAAIGRLVKMKEGRIGVFVTGRNMGYVKVGKTFLVQNSIFVNLDAVSKRVRKRLTRNVRLKMEEVDGVLLAWEEF